MAQGWAAPWYSTVRPKKYSPKSVFGSRAASIAHGHARRARAKGVEAIAPRGEVEAWVALERPCAYCGAPGTGIDHIVPLSKGGKHEISNFQPLCRTCNTIKLDLAESDLLAHLEKVLPALRAKVNGPQWPPFSALW
jgi:5-methylcytosine-specific restriction endonuclease McrA